MLKDHVSLAHSAQRALQIVYSIAKGRLKRRIVVVMVGLHLNFVNKGWQISFFS